MRKIQLFPVIREQEGNSALLGLIFVPLTSGRAKEGALDVAFPPVPAKVTIHTHLTRYMWMDFVFQTKKNELRRQNLPEVVLGRAGTKKCGYGSVS